VHTAGQDLESRDLLKVGGCRLESQLTEAAGHDGDGIAIIRPKWSRRAMRTRPSGWRRTSS
jgi:hypothetical protein